MQKSLAPEVERIAELLRRDSTAINAKSDINDFIREKKTGANKPARAEYEPYDPSVRCSGGMVTSLTATLDPNLQAWRPRLESRC